MSSKTIGGSSCAVATCVLNYSKAKRDGLKISFYRLIIILQYSIKTFDRAAYV